MLRLLLSTLAFLGLSSAHFILHWPPTAGFDDDLEATAPCGSFKPSVNSSSPDVQVDKFAVMIQNVHPVGQWAFLGTTNTQAPYNFTNISPLVNTTGIGDFCLENMRVPSEWAGKEGMIQVIDNSPDGILFQCAPVNFVSGSNQTAGPACTNATGFNAMWTNEQAFAGESSAATNTATASATGTATGLATTSASPSSSPSASSSGVAAPMITAVGSLVGGLGLLAAGFVL